MTINWNIIKNNIIIELEDARVNILSQHHNLSLLRISTKDFAPRTNIHYQ